MVLEKTLESPLGNKEVKSVNSKRNQPWIFIGRKEVLKLKLQYFGHLMQRADALEKTLMLGKIESRRTGRQDEMIGWHHWLNGHEFEQTQEDGEGQGSLACCSPWGYKESDTTERLNNNRNEKNTWSGRKSGDREMTKAMMGTWSREPGCSRVFAPGICRKWDSILRTLRLRQRQKETPEVLSRPQQMTLN